MKTDRRSFLGLLGAVTGAASIKPTDPVACVDQAVRAGAAVEETAPALPKAFVDANWTCRLDSRQHLWYDRLNLSGLAASNEDWVPLFREGVAMRGRDGHARTFLDTNLWQPAAYGFSAPTIMLAQRVGFLISPEVSDKDAQIFSKTATFEFKIVDKIYQQGRLDWQPAGQRRGSPANPHEKFFDLYETKLLMPLMPWSLSLIFPGGIPNFQNFEMFAFLDGIVGFSVQ